MTNTSALSSPKVAAMEPALDAWVLSIPATLEDEISGLVWSLGCTGITIERDGDERVRLVCFFARPDECADALTDLAASHSGKAERVRIANPDWVARFKETFVAFDAPPFRVVPEWSGENVGPLTIRIDPGRAFGTGTHESTRLCLQALGTIAPSLAKTPRALDLGCGTGILGIAAIKLAGARVIATDFDPLATESAAMHAKLNNVVLDVRQGDGCRDLEPGTFDLVFANLMAPFLIDRAAEICSMGAPGSRFILAGLLAVEENAVRAAWPPNWTATASYLGEWASLVYARQ